MILSPRWKKVVNDLWANKSRSLIVVMSIAVGIIAFGGLLTAQITLLSNLSTQFEESNPHDLILGLPPFDEAILRWAERQPFITGVQGAAVHAVDLVGTDETQDMLLTAYADFNDIDINRIAPERSQFPPDRGEFLLERSFLEPSGLAIGDVVTVERANGQQYELELVGTLHDLNKQAGFIADVLQGYITPPTLARMGLNADFNRLYLTIDRAALDRAGMTPTDLADDLRHALVDFGVPIQSITVEEVVEHWAEDNMNGIVTILVLVGFLALLLSGFLVVNTISGLLAQQKRVIGVMKIIGASRGQIIQLYLVLAGVFGVLALLIALPASLGVAWVMSVQLGTGLTNFNIDTFGLPPAILATEIAVAVLAPVLAALAPVLGGTSISAAAAVSDYASQGGTSALDRALAQISGLPRPLLLALRNVFRRKVRLVLTLITLVLAGAFFIAIINVRAAVQMDVLDINDMSSYDVQLTFTQPYDVAALSERALMLPGVTAVEGWTIPRVTRVRDTGVESEALPLYGVPAPSIFIEPTLLEGRWLQPLTPDTRYDVVVDDELVSNEPGITVGAMVTLKQNGADQQWRVVGILDNLPIDPDSPGTIYGHFDTVTRFTNAPDLTDTLLVQTTDSSPAFQNQMATTLETYFETRDFEIETADINSDFIATILSAFDIIVVLLLVTAVMIATVGALGLAGTMSLNVLERTREIGVLRSIGAATATLRYMFIAEGVTVGLISFVLAVLLSFPVTYFFGNLLGEVIREKPWSFVVTLTGPLLWLVIIVIVSALASIAPAQRASQVSIREALAYE